MVHELQELTDKITAVAEFTDDDTSEIEKDSKQQNKNCGSLQDL
jgi:hypothetical protein